VSAAILEVRGLSKAFGGVRAIDGIDLTLATGELRCIIGPNGAGKSTLFKLLLGSVKPDRGTIRFNERDITRLHPHQRAHLGIGVKFQNLGVYSNLSVRHNLQLPLQHTWSGDAMEREIAGLLERLNLSGTENQLVASLSHGQKQWLAIGMALAMRPALLLLDEPTAGMSPEETRATGELVRAVNAEGITALVVEHDMAFVRRLDAPVTVLHYGQVFAEGSLAEIENLEEVRHIYLGAAKLERRRGRHKSKPT
jgi:branched-chain amino acid transport system ATP-binding protein